MKKPLLKKKTKNILAISAALAILGGVLAAGIAKNGSLSDGIATTQETSIEAPIEDHGLNLKHAQTILGDGFHITKIFTYTITPSNASKEVTLDITWKDSSYQENTANYFSTSINTATCEITIKCIKAFDHVAIAKVTSKIDAKFSANITLDYVQKFTGFKIRNANGSKVMREDTITSSQGPNDEASFLKMITTQETATYYPTFTEVYTKKYPSGYTAKYTASYIESFCYTANSKLGATFEDRYTEVMQKVEASAGGALWQKQTQADLIEGIAKVYEQMSYDDQRLLNQAGYIGIKRSYFVKAYLDKDAEDTWNSYWVIKVDVSTLRSYLSDVNFSIEETNLDF